MALETTALLGAGVLITILHTVVPDHWLPFAVVGRARRWPLGRTLRLTLISSVAHVGITVLLGLSIALVSLQFLKQVEGMGRIVGAGTFVALGLAFLLLHWRHGHHPEASSLDNTTEAALFSLNALSPCYAILPLFLAVQDLGWGLALGLAAFFGLVTVAMMAALVLGASVGLVRATTGGAWSRLERHEGSILGGTLVALGIATLIL